MHTWSLDSAVNVSLSVKLGLEIFGAFCTFLAIYTRVVIYLARRKHHNPSKNETNLVALAELSRKNDKAEYERDIEKLKEDHQINLERARKEGYDDGEKAGHEKGYEAGKIDATRDFRLEFADFLNDEASRIRGQVEEVDKQDLPEISGTIPLPSPPKKIVAEIMLPSPGGSGERFNPYSSMR
jgi:hypothetical protein